MPEHGLQWLPRPSCSPTPSSSRLAGVFVGLGVRTIRLTGGEPTLHPAPGRAGRRLRRADAAARTVADDQRGHPRRHSRPTLVAAGLDRVNISLDTLDPARFRELTRRDRLGRRARPASSRRGGGRARRRSRSTRCWCATATSTRRRRCSSWALENGYQLRFIEHMPLDGGHTWYAGRDGDGRRDPGPARARLHAGRRGHGGERGQAPAEEFDVVDGPALGVLAAAAGPRRHHRVGDPAVLPRLRPAAADRGRPAAHLPVRPGRDRPARAAAGRREHGRTGRPDPDGGRRQAGRARHRHRSDFVQPARPMSAIGG